MESFDKEVISSGLAAEKKQLARLKAIYSKAADDISKKLELTNGRISVLLRDIDKLSDEERSVLQSQIYQRDFQRNLKSQLDLLTQQLTHGQYSSVSGYLEGCYENGFVGTLYSLSCQGVNVLAPINPGKVVYAMETDSKLSKRLYDTLGEDVGRLKKRVANNISRGISTSAPYAEIARNIAFDSNVGMNRAMRIVRTEGNRIQNLSAMDAANSAKEKGADLVKVWDSTLDSSTRDHHRELDGQIRELDEDFEVDGMSASAPGQFGIAAEDINCRCCVLVKPRWDTDSPFTKRDNETGQLLEFQDTKSYDEFKKKYWNAVDKRAESGIIGVGSEGMYRKSHPGKIEPMPKKQFRRIEKSFKAKGGIFQYGEETDAYLKRQNAEAITYNANTILLKQNPGRASVFEELIHATQYRNNENDGSYISRLNCEIAAQKKLLKNSKAYRLTMPEIEQTKIALKAYEDELDAYTKKGGD